VSPSSWFSSFDRDHVRRFETSERIEVRVVTLDAYCQKHHVAPTCIKVDVEGHELHVLRGARTVIAGAKPDLVVEVSNDQNTREGIWELLAPFDYRAYALVEAGLRRIPTLEEFCTAAPEASAIDAMFTADQELWQQLEARLIHP
jgi:hypothetical protein